MTYYQFIQAVEMKVKEGVEENVLIGVHTAEKNNGVLKRGIVLSRENVNISPTIYLEEYFQQYKRGRELDNIVRDIIGLYYEVRCEESWNEEKIQTFDAIEKKVIYRLVNCKENENLLKEVPHLCFLDLAITFHVLLEISDAGIATMLIRDEHLNLWGVEGDVLYGLAQKNTERLLPYEFMTMNAAIEELTGAEIVAEEEMIYILSNSIRSFGAAAILYENRLKNIGDYIGENYFILPSSVHEVIIVPESFAPPKELLSQMVQEINETQVLAEEVLEDHAYYYDRKLNQILL
ncbi:MAG: DUF5688 family protein [Dorea sp.]